MSYQTMKQCRKCFEVKALDEFSPRSKARDGVTSWCKACKADAQAESRRRNPEYDKDRYLEQKDRALSMKQLRYAVKHGRMPKGIDVSQLQFLRRLGRIAIFYTSDELVRIHNGNVSREDRCTKEVLNTGKNVSYETSADTSLKVCSSCGVSKDVSEFGSRKSAPDGLQYWCRACMNRSMRESRGRNPEYNKEYYERNRVQSLERRRVARAVKQGRLPRANTHVCSVDSCSNQAEHYHHLSYEKCAYLAPLCAGCHAKIHAGAVSEDSLTTKILLDGNATWCSADGVAYGDDDISWDEIEAETNGVEQSEVGA